MTRRRAIGWSAVLVLVGIAGRTPLESTMWSQMLLQIPALLAAGGFAATGFPLKSASWRGWNAHGASGLVLATGVVALWMIPRLLDAAAEQVTTDVLKAVTLWMAGFVGTVSWRTASTPVRLFFLGNMAWMTASVGLLLLDSQTRLCVNYGALDQQLAGSGLLVLTLFAVVTALVRGVHAQGGAEDASGRSPVQGYTSFRPTQR